MMTDTELKEMFMSALSDERTELSFVEEFVSDMAYNASGYDDPKSFFEDLQYGGCAIGMIGMLIYNDDCKDIYCRNIDDMESYLEEKAEEYGMPFENSKGLRHYVFVCWLCYELLADEIYTALFE